jgi:chemotaxis protein methyltransferase CheR
MDSGRCADFLAWALPRLGLAPVGFRRVKRQVCKRLHRRLKELRLPDLASYRQRLEAQPDEWAVVDRCCHITISRFYRDRRVFDRLACDIMPALAAAARDAGRRVLRVWSAGCASGEEPYTVSLIWRFALAARFNTISPAVVATDADETVLARARNALYPPGCLAELPREWVEAAFVREGRALRLLPEYRAGVTFLCQDLKTTAPDGPFDLLLCRNLAFTYFDEAGRRDALARLAGRLVPGGALVIGRGEHLPPDPEWLEPWIAELGIFRRRGAPAQ